MNVIRQSNIFAKLMKRNLLGYIDEELVPGVKDIIKDNYERRLLGVVPEGSLGRPEDFYDEFFNRLNEFKFVDDRGPTVKFIVPDNEKFDFSGDLSFLRFVLEGMTGFYYLIPIGTYRLLGYTPPDLQQSLYLVREDDPLMDDVRRILGETFLEPYAFSNSPPIDIFDRAEKYSRDNMSSLVRKAIASAEENFDLYSNRGL